MGGSIPFLVGYEMYSGYNKIMANRDAGRKRRTYLEQQVNAGNMNAQDAWIADASASNNKQINKLADLQAKARNSSGVGGEAELKKAANSTRAIMNQQLQSNIDTINTAYGTAGRYGSGANKQAVLQAQNSTNFNLANVVNQMSLQESQFQRNLEEERAWRQASLDAGRPGLADKIGDIANLGIQLYGTNPDYFNQKIGGLGEKLGIGGVSSNTYATSSSEPILGNYSEGNINQQNQPYGPSLSQAAPPVVYDETTESLNWIPKPVQQTTAPSYQPSPMDLFSTPTQQSKEQQVQKFVSTPTEQLVESPYYVDQLSDILLNANIPTQDIFKLATLWPRLTKEEKADKLKELLSKGGTNGKTIQSSK